MKKSKLEFKEVKLVSGGYAGYVHFRDFVINGRSVKDILREKERASVFGWLTEESERRIAAQLVLMREPELPTGRVPLYVCQVCGDCGCGVIAVRVEEAHDAIIWSDFAIEADYQQEDGSYEMVQYPYVGPYHFDKDQYCAAFTAYTAYGGV